MKPGHSMARRECFKWYSFEPDTGPPVLRQGQQPTNNIIRVQRDSSESWRHWAKGCEGQPQPRNTGTQTQPRPRRSHHSCGRGSGHSAGVKPQPPVIESEREEGKEGRDEGNGKEQGTLHTQGTRTDDGVGSIEDPDDVSEYMQKRGGNEEQKNV